MTASRATQNETADFEELTRGLTQGATLLEQCLESEADCATVQQAVGALSAAWIYAVQQRCMSELGPAVGKDEVPMFLACLRSQLSRHEFYRSTAMRGRTNEAIRVIKERDLKGCKTPGQLARALLRPLKKPHKKDTTQKREPKR